MSTPRLLDFDPAAQRLIRLLLAQASAKKVTPIATPVRPVVSKP